MVTEFMKRFTSVVLFIALITFQLLWAAGCNKQNTTTPTQTTTQEQITGLPQESLKPIVNLSKDPSDYEIPSKLPYVFSITCVSYVSMGKTHFVDAFADNKEGICFANLC